MHVSLILPAYNEEKNLSCVVDESIAQLENRGIEYDIYVVDDGSNDCTAALIKGLSLVNSHLTGTFLNENQGFGGAVRAGIKVAKTMRNALSKKDSLESWIVIMDADGQLKLSDWLRCKPWLESNIDLWWGIRERRAEGTGRMVISRIYNMLCRYAFGTPEVQDVECGLKAIRFPFVSDNLPSVRGATINPLLFASALKQGANVRQFPVRHLLRQYGQPTGLSPKVIIRSLKELVTLSTREKNAWNKEFSDGYQS